MEALLEYAALVKWITDIGQMLEMTNAAILKDKHNINLMQDQKMLQADFDNCKKVLRKLQPKVKKHFEVKYELKLKSII